MPDAPAIRLTGLHRRFGDFVAVQPLDLEMADGEFFSLIGPSGCGKTTTLRMIAGLDQPTAGTIEVHGRDVTRDPAYRRPVNTVFQHYALFPHLSIFENVAFGLRERRMSRKEIEPRVRRMLDLVHLAGRERGTPRELSGGQQQRVALARALVLEPQVLLLDEPLGALDLKLRKNMQRLLREIQREVGITFVYVTHDQEEAFSMSTRVGVMSGGVLEQVGAPKDVYRRPATRFVADFVGSSNHLPVTVSGATGPGRYAVTLSSDGTSATACGPAGLAAGTPAQLVVRPEAIVVGESSPGEFSTGGRVVDTSYSGPHTELLIETRSTGVLRVAKRGDEEDDLKLGDTAVVSWPASGSWLVPQRSADEPNQEPAAPAMASSTH
jgi:spermidine/putrescine transport system ATP-binding protein